MQPGFSRSFGIRMLVVCMLALMLPAWAQADSDHRTVKVMTQNMDAGTDFGYIFGATDVTSLMAGATATFAEVQASGLPQRAAALAEEIGGELPDLVALQEVTLWRTGPFGGPATTVVYDQLALLLEALARHGLDYYAAAVNELSDTEVPMSFLQDLRLTDRDVILARSGTRPVMALSDVQMHRYEAFLSFSVPGVGQLSVFRGWMSVDVKTRGKSFRFANTHLEGLYPTIPFSKFIQLAQAGELAAALSTTRLPVILGGDFNSNAELGPDHSGATDLMLAAGFKDAWRVSHPPFTGYTWPLFLEDPVRPSQPFERIDLIYTRDVDVLDVRLRDNPSASDHAGVIAAAALE